MQPVDILRAVFTILYGGICAYTDLRFRAVDLRYSLVAGIAGVCLLVFGKEASGGDFLSYFYPFVPGLILLAAAFLTRGAIGIGDAIFILIQGLYFNTAEIWTILVLSWTLSAVVGLVVIAFSRKNIRSLRGKGLPFATLAFPVILIELGSRYI